jgi:class 3 adenylate cyclase/predicted ATPase
MSDMQQWLDDMGLGQYAETFAESDVDYEILPELTEQDLKDMNVSLGHRRKILKAISQLGGEAKVPEPEAPVASEAKVENRQAAPAEAERRQLTVMFCDLVGSTALSETLDPEDLGGVMSAYRAAAEAVVTRYDGHVAQYLGDGLMVYFGWPRAHEDDAYRSVRAGLDIVEAVAALDAPAALSVRIGIATGLVVVGAGDGQSDARLAVGETPNIAARLQALAQPHSVVIGQSTRRLLGGAFELTDLGEHELKGVSGPAQIHRVVGEAQADSRFEATHGLGLTAMVGRETEISLLLDRWDQAKDGEGQVVLLEGEAGIGKSRVTAALHERLTDESHTRLRYQGSPYYTNSAFYPIITQIEQAAGFVRDDSADAKLDKLEAVIGDALARPLFASMLSLPTARYPSLNLEPGKQKEETIAALTAEVGALARQQPVLMIFEDAHWYDPTTLETLAALIRSLERAAVLMVITYRPEFEPPWSGHGYLTNISLNRLSRRQGTDMVARVTGGKALPDEVLDQIVAKTDGVPLFVEELTKTVLEADILEERETEYVLTGPLPPLAIPETLQDSLMARLDRLSPVKEVAQIGACIGREFNYEILAAVTPLRDNELQDSLVQLTNAELIFRQGTPPEATYTFKHALVQDAAYESLLKSKRQQLHTNIAQILEERFPDLVDTEPELAAHHYTAAGLGKKAIPLWMAAGQRALGRSANLESVAHLTNARELIGTLPVGKRREALEVEVLNALGVAVLTVNGYGSDQVGAIYARAQALCERVGDAEQRMLTLFGVWAYHTFKADYVVALSTAEQLLALAESVGDVGGRIVAYGAMTPTMFFMGKHAEAVAYAEQGVALYQPSEHSHLATIYGHDPGAFCHDFGAQAALLLGFPERAVQMNAEALLVEKELGHTLTTASMLVHSALFHSYRRDAKATLSFADAGIAFSNERGIPFRSLEADLIKGWAMAELGDAEAGVALIQGTLVPWRQIGADIIMSWWWALLARALHLAGRHDEALATLRDAMSFAEEHNELAYLPELLRLKGNILLDVDEQEEAEACFEAAVARAREMDAKFWELGAATCLARLWHSQGKTAEALALLAPVYDWFTEGFDSADLKEAKALLDDLK